MRSSWARSAGARRAGAPGKPGWRWRSRTGGSTRAAWPRLPWGMRPRRAWGRRGGARGTRNQPTARPHRAHRRSQGRRRPRRPGLPARSRTLGKSGARRRSPAPRARDRGQREARPERHPRRSRQSGTFPGTSEPSNHGRIAAASSERHYPARCPGSRTPLPHKGRTLGSARSVRWERYPQGVRAGGDAPRPRTGSAGRSGEACAGARGPGAGGVTSGPARSGCRAWWPSTPRGTASSPPRRRSRAG